MTEYRFLAPPISFIQSVKASWHKRFRKKRREIWEEIELHDVEDMMRMCRGVLPFLCEVAATCRIQGSHSSTTRSSKRRCHFGCLLTWNLWSKVTVAGDAEWMESSRATFISNLSSHGSASPIPQPPTWLLADQYSSGTLISHYCGGANSPGTGGVGTGCAETRGWEVVTSAK